MDLCQSCRMRGDRLAEGQENPDAFKRKIGEYAELVDHSMVHEELERLYELRFGKPTLDSFLTERSILA